MSEEEIDSLTQKAVWAALGVIDEATGGKGKRSEGPLGDKLAYALHGTIEGALKEHFGTEKRSE